MNITRLSPKRTSPLRSLLLVLSLLLAGGLFLFPVSSVAQSSMDGPSTLVEHLQKNLQSKNYDYSKREAALIDIVGLAACADQCTVTLRSVSKKQLRAIKQMGTGSTLDLNALVPDLLESYRSGPADGHRLLALSALINIGNEEALDQLVDEGARQSENVNRSTQRSLANFYLEKYPKLRNRARHTRQLSLDDVGRARAVEVRRAKKAAKKEAKGKS